MKKVFFSVITAGLMFTACGDGGSDQKQETEEKPKVQLQQAEEEEEEIAESIELTIEGNDAMKFNKEKLTVHEGQEVTLTLAHTGEMSLEAMGLNFVLLNEGVDIADFSAAAIDAGLDAQYIPEGREDDIIAHTDVIGGGDETTITFEAPAKGTYDFICSFPGHSGMMKGKFVVK